ncbi:MAG: hypothetical protein ACLU3I_06660 [Acutalibacteraceae bacterium]
MRKKRDPNAIERARIQYIINPIECGDRSEEAHRTRVGRKLRHPHPRQRFLLHGRKRGGVSGKTSKSWSWRKCFPGKSMERVWSVTYQALYLNYDIQEDFRKQFQKTATVLIDALEQLPALWKELSHE